MAVDHEPISDRTRNEFDQLKGTFLSSLNHEIRTPLSGILGMADLLLETQLDEEQREYVTAARMCAESLFQILNATLEYSALEAGTLTLDESEFGVRDLLETTVSQTREKAENKGILLEQRFDRNLPETLIGDAPRIRDILGHLLDNAVKFTSEGKVQLHVTAEPGREAGVRLIAEIRDTGIGIPEDQQAQIFESFRQGEDGLARGYSGLGLGLALVRKLVHLMGGEISVDSEPGRGSVFTVQLPLRVPGDAGREPHTGSSDSSAPYILAVEDNAVGMMVLRHALKGRNVRIECAMDGHEALEAARKRRFDVVLMDLQMPGMDGLETTTAMRQIPGYEDVPILALTADSSDDVRRECLQHGMQGFLSKPVDSGLLWAAVSRHLSPVTQKVQSV